VELLAQAKRLRALLEIRIAHSHALRRELRAARRSLLSIRAAIGESDTRRRPACAIAADDDPIALRCPVCESLQVQPRLDPPYEFTFMMMWFECLSCERIWHLDKKHGRLAVLTDTKSGTHGTRS
jgi:hypothetical protein